MLSYSKACFGVPKHGTQYGGVSGPWRTAYSAVLRARLGRIQAAVDVTRSRPVGSVDDPADSYAQLADLLAQAISRNPKDFRGLRLVPIGLTKDFT